MVKFFNFLTSKHFGFFVPSFNFYMHLKHCLSQQNIDFISSFAEKKEEKWLAFYYRFLCPYYTYIYMYRYTSIFSIWEKTFIERYVYNVFCFFSYRVCIFTYFIVVILLYLQFFLKYILSNINNQSITLNYFRFNGKMYLFVLMKYRLHAV